MTVQFHRTDTEKFILLIFTGGSPLDNRKALDNYLSDLKVDDNGEYVDYNRYDFCDIKYYMDVLCLLYKKPHSLNDEDFVDYNKNYPTALKRIKGLNKLLV
jgi:hypothetical protein